MNFLKTTLTKVKATTADIETKINAFENKPTTTDVTEHPTAVPTHSNVISSANTESVTTATNAMSNALPTDVSSATAATTPSTTESVAINDTVEEVETKKDGLLNKMEGAFSSMGLKDETKATNTTATADVEDKATSTTVPGAKEGFMGSTLTKVSTINHEVEEKATGLLDLVEGKKDNLTSSTAAANTTSTNTPAATETAPTKSGLLGKLRNL